MRRAISLLEVLISMFIIAIGMLGVAALIGAGTSALNDTAKADRSAACGRAAMREVKVRKMLNPVYSVAGWSGVDSQGNVISVPEIPTRPYWYASDMATVVPSMDGAFVFDPLLIVQRHIEGVDPALFATFPASDPDGLPRLTLDIFEPGFSPLNNLGLAEKMYEKVFLWTDDKIFDRPDDEDKRPNGPGVPQLRYSWMLTAVPKVGSTYAVSVIVFYRRDMESERVAAISFQGGGYGGGDVLLQAPSGVANPEEYLEVKPGTWIMVYTITPNAIAYWYRVVSADNVDGDTRRLTIAGPDWHHGPASAVLLNSVIAVYNKTISVGN
jgi:type II secretory pathway pseudopilin PulG